MNNQSYERIIGKEFLVYLSNGNAIHSSIQDERFLNTERWVILIKRKILKTKTDNNVQPCQKLATSILQIKVGKSALLKPKIRASVGKISRKSGYVFSISVCKDFTQYLIFLKSLRLEFWYLSISFKVRTLFHDYFLIKLSAVSSFCVGVRF